MAKRKYIYCWNCGLKNLIKDDKCKKCKKKLKEKEMNETGAFVLDKIIDKAKDESEEIVKKGFRDAIGNYLFGIVLSASMIFTGSTVVANILEDQKEPKDIHTIVQNAYQFEAMIEAHDQTCENGFTLKDGECVKEIINPAKRDLSCEQGYMLSGNSCRQEFEKQSVTECLVPADYEYSYADQYEPCDVIETKYVDEDFGCMTAPKRVYKDQTNADGTTTRVCSGTSIPTDFIPPTTYMKCPSGTSEINGRCYKMAKAKETYSCTEGSLAGKNCITTEKGILSGKCDEDYTYNELFNLCIKNKKD